MAVLEKIRSKGVLLLIVIGAAMLIFIVSDFINSSSTYFQEKGANVAVINGEKVKVDDYQGKLEQLKDVFRLELGDQKMDESELDERIKYMAWQSTLSEKLFADDCAELGMTVTTDELADLMCGQHVSPVLQSSKLFLDQNGMFSVAAVKQIIQLVDDPALAEQSQLDDDSYRRIQNCYRYWESTVKNTRLQEKYTTLLGKSMVVNPLEAQYSYDNAKNTSDILCTYKNYALVSDSTIKVEESEIKARYDKQIERYKRESRAADIKYIALEIAPSKEDFDEAAAFLSEVRNDLETTDDAASVVNANSDVPFVDVPMFESQVPEEYRTFAFSGSDSIYGPVLFGNTFKMCKVVERSHSADSVKLRMIVLKEETEEATKAKGDSIMALFANGADFGQLAYDNSLASNKDKGGEVDWLTELSASTALDKESAAKAFSTPVGQTFRIDTNGICFIYLVTEIRNIVPKVKLAMVEHEVVASTKTHTAIYNKLQQFAAKSQDVKSFQDNAVKENMPIMDAKNLDINATRINSMPQMREAVRWVFENEEGKVSDVIEPSSQNYIIAIAVIKQYEEGYRSIDEVRDIITAEIRKEKKGEQLVAQMKGKSVSELESMGWQTDTIAGVNFNNSSFSKIGWEPVMAAHVNFVEVGRTSEAIKGTNNAFLFTVLDRVASEVPYDEKEAITMLSAREMQYAYQISLEALKRAAEIKDFRYKYY